MSDRESVSPRIPWGKLAGLGCLVAALLAIVYLSPLKHYLNHWQEASRAVHEFGIWAPLVFGVVVAALVAVGFPRLLFCVIGGMTFGFWPGLLWTQLATLAGTYAVFLFARSHADWARKYIARHSKLDNFVRQQGMAGVILARQIPVPSVIINLAFGLFSVGHRDFLLGSLAGQLPEAIPCTMIGAGLLRSSFKESVGLIALAVAAGVLLFLSLRYWLRPASPTKETVSPPR